MSTKNTITIDGDVYTRETTAGEWSVVVIENGWIILGKFDAEHPKHEVRITDAYCVRRFGFGIGVASFTKKREELILDQFPSAVAVPTEKVLFTFDLPSEWELPDANRV